MKKSTCAVREFKQYHNLSAVLDKQRSRDELMGYDHSELNCLQCIGKMEHPNVTLLAEEMHMTRGAISKIVQKLMEKELITSYQQPGNRQKVFYSLTELGRQLFDEHELRHRKWEREEMRFFNTVDKETLDTVISFMQQLNAYLESRIRK